MGYGQGVSDLIRRPQTAVTRPIVHAVLRRLQTDGTVAALGRAVRTVDEYAASLHTERVHLHAQRILAQALVEADYHTERGKKIFVGIVAPDSAYVKNFPPGEGPEDGKNFFTDEFEKYVKKIFKTTFSPAVRILILDEGGQADGSCRDGSDPIDRARTATGVPDTSGKGALATDCPDTPDTVPPVTDTGDSATPATDTRDTDTPDTDTGDTVPAVPDTNDSQTGATGDTDTSDSSDPIVRMPLVDMSTVRILPLRMLTDDASTVRTPGDMAPGGPGRPDDNAHTGVGVKTCTVCNSTLPLSGFNRNKSRPDGFANECRDCHASRGEAYRARRRARKAAESTGT